MLDQTSSMLTLHMRRSSVCMQMYHAPRTSQRQSISASDSRVVSEECFMPVRRSTLKL